MRQVPLQYASKSLRARFDYITEEPLPRRWVELIHRLNEIERRQTRGVSQSNERTDGLDANIQN